VGGYYGDHGYLGSTNGVFVVNETNGRWGTAIKMPGLATLNTGDDAEVNSVSCAAPGECAAGGNYLHAGSHDRWQAFVVSEVNGSWGKAIRVPGIGALNTTGGASVESISCPAPGECAAGGYYDGGKNDRPAFVVSEANGTWGHAIEVPGTET